MDVVESDSCADRRAHGRSDDGDLRRGRLIAGRSFDIDSFRFQSILGIADAKLAETIVPPREHFTQRSHAQRVFQPTGDSCYFLAKTTQ